MKSKLMQSTLVLSLTFALQACGGKSDTTTSEISDNPANTQTSSDMSNTQVNGGTPNPQIPQRMTIQSNDITNYQFSSALTPDGNDENPQVSWSNIPQGTQGFALIMDDPDAKQVVGHTVVHWNLFSNDGNLTTITRNSSNQLNANTQIEGLNYTGNAGYTGPNPPTGQRHQYRLCIYALNSKPSDFIQQINQASYTNHAFESQYQAHILGSGCLTAFYSH